MQLLLIHGPNHSQLGSRDPAQYGTATLQDVVDAAREEAATHGGSLEDLQSEYEGVVIERLHKARVDGTDGIIINAGAWTHYAYALHDALEMITKPCIEVHLSNLQAREPFRHRSVIAPVCDGVIAGFGIDGYPLAVRAAVALHQRRGSA